jgi:LPXTG-site transpeptidase (sortase) family protein
MSDTMISTDEVDAWLMDLETEAQGAEVEISKPPSHMVAMVVRRGLLIFAGTILAFLAFALWFSGLSHARSQVGLQRRFHTELGELSAPVSGVIAAGSPVAILRAPSIGVNEVVVEGARSGQLRAGPGHVVGSPLPGQPGNAVIAGRRMLYGGPFEHLNSLHRGDRISMITGQGDSTYRVIDVKAIGATHGSVFSDHGDNRLTLFTADPPLQGSRRLVVTAKLVERPYAATDLSTTLDPEGLGLTGERGAIAVVLVWLELLVALALLAVFALKRWSRWATWVVFVPALALVVWLFFEHAVQLLPATL